MNADLKKRWVQALKSGDYKQGRGSLNFKSPANAENAFCCLGVLCEVAGVEKVESFGRGAIGYQFEKYKALSALHTEALERFGLNATTAGLLIGMNDDQKRSFWFIADFIEANVPIDGTAATTTMQL